MRVVLNGIIVDTQPSGLGHYVIQLSKHLARLVDLVVITARPEMFPDIECVKTPDKLLSTIFRFRGYGRYWWIQTGLRSLVRKQEPDVLLSPNHEIMQHPPVKQVAVIHDLIPMFSPEGELGKHLYFKHVLPGLLRKHCSRIITVSQATKNDLLEHLGIPEHKVQVAVSGLGAQLGEKRPGLPLPEHYVLYTGRFMPYKNIESLIRAFARISHDLPHHLVLAGPSADRSAGFAKTFMRIAEELGIRHRVHFPGYIPRESLGWVYKKASLFVLPSFYEGFGFPPLEAMACGTPVAVSRIPALVETVADAGLYFEPESVDEMARVIRKALTDNQWREAIVNKARERLGRFSWKNTAQTVYRVLEEVAAR